MAVGGAAGLATAGVAYLGFKNKAAISSMTRANLKTLKRTFHKGNMQLPHIASKARRKAGYAGRYIAQSHRPFTIGYKTNRAVGNTRRQGIHTGMGNMYKAHKPHVINAMNKGAKAFHSYRRIRRDYKGRFNGSI